MHIAPYSSLIFVSMSKYRCCRNSPVAEVELEYTEVAVEEKGAGEKGMAEGRVVEEREEGSGMGQ